MKLIDCFSELLAYTVYIAGKGSTADHTYDEANARYEDLLGRAGSLRSRLEVPDRDWDEAKFAVSAYIDEMILCSAWAGKDAWQVNQLQHRFFNTTNAGAEFFEHLAGLDPGREDVREVYDWCLAMGFKGTYFRTEDSTDLEEITKQNQSLMRQRANGRDDLFMFPEAYGADRKEGRKGISGLFLYVAITGLIPLIIFFGLYYFYSNILNGILAMYFQ